MNQRTIVLCPPGPIDQSTVKEFLEVLSILDSSKGPLEIRICSDGGWTLGAVAIYDAIKQAQNKVTTVGCGTVGSAAVLVLQAGDRRLMMPNCTLFLHESYTTVEASMTAAKIIVDEGQRIHNLYCDLIAERSGKSKESIRQLCKVESFLPADKALKAGFIDGIYGKK